MLKICVCCIAASAAGEWSVKFALTAQHAYRLRLHAYSHVNELMLLSCTAENPEPDAILTLLRDRMDDIIADERASARLHEVREVVLEVGQGDVCLRTEDEQKSDADTVLS